MKNLKILALGVIVSASVLIIGCGNSDPLLDTELKDWHYYNDMPEERVKKRKWCLLQIGIDTDEDTYLRTHNISIRQFLEDTNKKFKEKLDNVNYHNCYYNTGRRNHSIPKL